MRGLRGREGRTKSGDYPEKKIKSMDVAGKKKKIQIPAALASMLPAETRATIVKEWQKRYPKYF
ncbi:MAG TPA: hypothetical protein PKN99_11075 [Cyclobacteriaceae bacterium]|nr:hypothetical protein [Cyclobacteriaceae bacterium]